MTTTYPFGSKTISYTYDRLGNRQSATYPDGPAPLNYSYDDLNRLTAINYGASAVTYSYDNAGRPTAKTLPNGITTTYTHDNANRLTSLTNRRSDTSIISAFTYTHDNTGNRLTMTETTGTHNYNYDNIYRLTGAAHPATSTETYTYDRVGNRLTSATEPSWNYDANNRLLSYDGITFTHDNNGNTTSKDEGATLTTYSYDQENRLTTAIPGALVVTYGYDPFGKRLSKTIGGATTYYLYDEEDIIAEYDQSGALTATYIHGQGIDEPISMTRGGQTYYYTFDGLGSVKDLTDSTQTLVEQYDYDSFGNLTAPPTTGNPYTYTSREYDPETGLYFYRARYYDPTIGRFLTEDPIGFEGGANFYVYVYNQPTLYTDSQGLSPEEKSNDCDKTKKCPPCPDPPPSVFHKVPPHQPHWPCKSHIHYFVYHQAPWPKCTYRLRRYTVCADDNGNPISNSNQNPNPVPVSTPNPNSVPGPNPNLIPNPNPVPIPNPNPILSPNSGPIFTRGIN